jgi:pimeloyl-ACP methyl ester carboxylesterase
MDVRFLFGTLILSSAMVGCASDPVEEAPLGTTQEAVQAQRPHRHHGPDCGHDSGEIVRSEHSVTVGSGATLHMYEHHTDRAMRKHKRRAVLFLPATIVTNIIWNADVPAAPEYNALDRTADEDYFAYTLDYEGYGQSSLPSNGADVTAERMLSDLGDLVEWIRHEHGIPKVDLVGSSLGSALAVALGGTQSPIPRQHVGKVVLTAHVYKTVTPFAAQVLLSPENQALLEAAPNGYVDTFDQMYGIILAAADPAPAAYCFANCPGHYATGPTLSGFDLPVFDAKYGRAPLLQFWGDQDMITPAEDVEQFQNEYGGHAELEVLEGGGHVPHWESVRDTFWDKTFDFLD